MGAWEKMERGVGWVVGWFTTINISNVLLNRKLYYKRHFEFDNHIC